ncbi:anthranilate synthase component II [Paenibacillus aurantiacus]|uniref:Anthranilate synthase component II n=1 Tax=Paenibacillus aurantiacus TaxID=1936118 RepID=A0ABV5KLH6_9BACL
MKALVVDAYDSFVYIIYQYLLKLDVEAVVVRNDRLGAEDAAALAPDFIVLGPGPGHPSEARYGELIRRFGRHTPILGVCLGHQAIGLEFGARVECASHLMHGKTSRILHDGEGCFAGIPSPFRATRYHSLIVGKEGLPDCLEVTAESEDDGYIMGLRHKEHPIESIQFHPESIYTEHGLHLFRNFIQIYVNHPLEVNR